MTAILKTTGAPAFYLAIFLNALIDLGHKITIQNTVFKIHDGSQQIILIAIINGLILLPYILLVVPIGRVANRTAKPTMIKFTAWCSLALTLIITLFYWLGWFWPAFAMTLLMAVQSAFYSPAKLSYLKVYFGEHSLPEANGLAQAIVIAGILLGTVVFSLGFEYLYPAAPDDKSAVTASMYPLGLVLVGLALVQLYSAYQIAVLPEPSIENASNTVTAAPKIVNVLASREVLIPVLLLALFWSVGQGMLAAFPAFAKAHAGIENAAVIQGVLASTAIGIGVGAYFVGRFSKGGILFMLVPLGVAGLSLGLWSLTLLSSAAAFALAYFTMGVASALLIVPMNAFIQLRASGDKIGVVIAASNFIQNIGMLLMLGLTIAFALAGVDSARLLQMMALLTTVLGSGLAWLIIGFKAEGNEEKLAKQ